MVADHFQRICSDIMHGNRHDDHRFRCPVAMKILASGMRSNGAKMDRDGSERVGFPGGGFAIMLGAEFVWQ